MSTLHTTPSGNIIKQYLCAEIKGICTKVRKICFRLLKGAPPGQEAVNHYISELSIVKGGNHKLDTKYRKHLAMIEVNLDSNFFIPSIRVDCTSFLISAEETHCTFCGQFFYGGKQETANIQVLEGWFPLHEFFLVFPFHISVYFRLVRMSTTTTTSFLGKVPWTGRTKIIFQKHLNISFSRDFQFHNPQLVKDYVNQIRRV